MEIDKVYTKEELIAYLEEHNVLPDEIERMVEVIIFCRYPVTLIAKYEDEEGKQRSKQTGIVLYCGDELETDDEKQIEQ